MGVRMGGKVQVDIYVGNYWQIGMGRGEGS